ncbi:MAG: Na+/H+ antiporter subunit B [Phycisphaeraceae bacterium]|nr:MAG: Na+/H+ antiporter subunit B [Phycisphaeraceae bacterium]
MNSIILQTATRYLLPLLLLFSLFLLWRGHNEPGGGFVGGLVAASAIALQAIAFGPARARQAVRIDLRALIAIGLITALVSGIPALMRGDSYMQAYWMDLGHESIGYIKVGTPLIFDIGVYLTVIGVALLMIITVAEE